MSQPTKFKSFKQLREALVAADQQVVDDWNSNYCWSHPALEARISFIEFRRDMLAGAVGSILTMLIEMEENGQIHHHEPIEGGKKI